MSTFSFKDPCENHDSTATATEQKWGLLGKRWVNHPERSVALGRTSGRLKSRTGGRRVYAAWRAPEKRRREEYRERRDRKVSQSYDRL